MDRGSHAPNNYEQVTVTVVLGAQKTKTTKQQQQQQQQQPQQQTRFVALPVKISPSTVC